MSRWIGGRYRVSAATALGTAVRVAPPDQIRVRQRLLDEEGAVVAESSVRNMVARLRAEEFKRLASGSGLVVARNALVAGADVLIAVVRGGDGS